MKVSLLVNKAYTEKEFLHDTEDFQNIHYMIDTLFKTQNKKYKQTEKSVSYFFDWTLVCAATLVCYMNT